MLTQPEQIFQTFSFLEMDEDNDALDSKIQTFHLPIGSFLWPDL